MPESSVDVAPPITDVAPSWDRLAPSWTPLVVADAGPARAAVPAVSDSPAAVEDRLPEPGPHAWRWALFAIGFVLAVTELGSRALTSVGRKLQPGTAPRLLILAGLLLVTDIAVIAAIRLFALRRADFTTDGLGLRPPTSRSDAVVLGFATWVMFMMFAGMWSLVITPKETVPVRSPVPTDQPNQQAVPTLDNSTSPKTDDQSTSEADRKNRHQLLNVLSDHPPVSVLLILLVSICIAAPLTEELFFRGFLYRSVAVRYGETVGVGVSALLFGLAHFWVVPLPMTVPLGVLGGALAVLFRHTKSIVPGIAVHGFVNAVGAGGSAGLGWGIPALVITTFIVLMLLVSPWTGPRPSPQSTASLPAPAI